MKKSFVLLSLLTIGLTATFLGHSNAPSVTVYAEDKKEEKELPLTEYKDNLFVKDVSEAEFKDGILKGNTYSIKVVDNEVEEIDGDKYMVFVFDTIVHKEYKDEPSLSPYFAWTLNFTAIQDNDKNKVNELESITPKEYEKDEFAKIKPGGVVRSAIAYKLTDGKTPVTLVAGDWLGTNFGTEEYKLDN